MHGPDNKNIVRSDHFSPIWVILKYKILKTRNKGGNIRCVTSLILLSIVLVIFLYYRSSSLVKLNQFEPIRILVDNFRTFMAVMAVMAVMMTTACLFMAQDELIQINFDILMYDLPSTWPHFWAGSLVPGCSLVPGGCCCEIWGQRRPTFFLDLLQGLWICRESGCLW